MNLRHPARLALVAALAFVSAATPAFARWQAASAPRARPRALARQQARQQARPQPYGRQQPSPIRPNAGPYSSPPYAQRPAQPYGQQPPAPIVRPNAPAGPPGQQPYAVNRGAQPYPGNRAQPSISRWMAQHQNQPLDEQLRDLSNEPGFSQHTPAEQQNMRNQLMQLNQMPPAQRAQRLARLSTLESLTPEQTQRWREGLQQMSSGPPMRQQMMRSAFRNLRELPPAQREQVINSPAFAAQFSPEERNAVSGALLGEPYPPIR